MITIDFSANAYNRNWAREQTLIGIENLYFGELYATLDLIKKVADKGFNEITFRPEEIREEVITWLQYKQYAVSTQRTDEGESVVMVSW